MVCNQPGLAAEPKFCLDMVVFVEVDLAVPLTFVELRIADKSVGTGVDRDLLVCNVVVDCIAADIEVVDCIVADIEVAGLNDCLIGNLNIKNSRTSLVLGYITGPSCSKL